MKKHERELVTVATFDDRPDAQHLKAWLEHEQVDAEIQDETRLQKYWFFVAPKAGIHVQTTRATYERANSLLHNPEAAPLLANAVVCPCCGSSHVQYPDLTRKNILPNLLGQLFVVLHVTQHKYYCEHCHFTWQTDPPK